MLTLCPAGSLEGQDLDPADVQVMLDWALHIAQRAAAKRFPGGVDYLLYSVTPRVLKEIPAVCTGRCGGRCEPSLITDG